MKHICFFILFFSSYIYNSDHSTTEDKQRKKLLLSLINSLFSSQPTQRYTIQSILSHHEKQLKITYNNIHFTISSIKQSKSCSFRDFQQKSIFENNSFIDKQEVIDAIGLLLKNCNLYTFEEGLKHYQTVAKIANIMHSRQSGIIQRYQSILTLQYEHEQEATIHRIKKH